MMEKYKRFKEVLVDDIAIQNHLNKISSEGWEIIYYNEKDYGAMGMKEIVIVGKKRFQYE